MKRPLSLFVSLASAALIAACGGEDGAPASSSYGTEPASTETAAGETPDATPDAAPEEEGHAHAEDPLGTITIGDLEVELAQGHGVVVAGGEGHLVVKLPYSDSGSTTVRAWIGTKDRTLSYVGKGEYAPSHDDYDIHATAPDPLPENPMWWIEIEKPDGTKVVGSAKPILE